MVVEKKRKREEKKRRGQGFYELFRCSVLYLTACSGGLAAASVTVIGQEESGSRSGTIHIYHIYKLQYLSTRNLAGFVHMQFSCSNVQTCKFQSSTTVEDKVHPLDSFSCLVMVRITKEKKMKEENTKLKLPTLTLQMRSYCAKNKKKKVCMYCIYSD